LARRASSTTTVRSPVLPLPVMPTTTPWVHRWGIHAAAGRLLRSIVLVWDRCDAEPGASPARQLPVIVPIVLSQATRHWTAALWFQQLVGDPERALPGTQDKVPSFPCFVFDLRAISTPGMAQETPTSRISTPGMAQETPTSRISTPGMAQETPRCRARWRSVASRWRSRRAYPRRACFWSGRWRPCAKERARSIT
jgi:hypothetical protein